jgi:hypothetical protein
LISDYAILVGKHIQTGITSKPTFLFMEQSLSWSVILQFLLENISKQELLQNKRFYSWSSLEVGQWLCNSCGKTNSNKNHFQNPCFYSWSIIEVGQ